MRKAREVWRLKLEGVNSKKISTKLSIPSNVINIILEHTVSDHYITLIKKPSYYDEQLSIKQKISLDKKKLQKISDSIAYKKKIFYMLLQLTAVTIITLIVI